MLALTHFGKGTVRMRQRVRVGHTNTAILHGDLDLREWSDEELMRGQRRAKNGTFVGRPPKVVPKSIHDELVRRKMSKAHDLLRDNVVAATEVLVEIATDRDADASVRLKAATTILDRVLGKAPETVHVDATLQAPWLEAVNAGIVSIATRAVIDADSWEADDEAS